MSLRDLFCRELTAAGGEVLFARTAAEAHAELRQVLRTSGVKTVAHHAAATLAPIDPETLRDEWELCGPHGAVISDCARAEAGLTGCCGAVASTGTILMAAGAQTPRSTSLLPPLHIAVLHEEQIVADLASALRRFPLLPSQLIHITGPSRTGDIEHDLTRGVHGPGRIVVLLLEARIGP